MKWKFADQTTTGEQWPVAEVFPYEKNAKLHSPSQVKQLSAIMEEMGVRSRIQIKSNGEIINGHGRFEALKALGFKKVPVDVIDDLSEDKIRALRLLDNKVVSDEYDYEKMSDELAELVGDMEDFDMGRFFSDKELEFATGDLGEMNLDALTDDLAGEVDAKSKETADKISGQDGKEESVAKILGFSKVTGDQKRALIRLKAHVEAITDDEGAQAWALYAKEHVGV